MPLLETSAAQRLGASRAAFPRGWLVQILLFALWTRAVGAPHRASAQIVSDSQANPATNAQTSIGLLKQLASEQVLRDGEFLGKTRFRVNRENKTYFYDLTQAPAAFILARSDPYEVPLEALIRVEALRRDFKASVPKEDFWVVPLEGIERVAGTCVIDLEAVQPNQELQAAQQRCTARIQAKFDGLGESISSFAAAHKLSLSESFGTRDPALGYRIQIKIEPPKAHIKVMPLLEYKKYQYFKVPPDQYRWNDLVDSETEMIGWYHFRAEWPPELNGPEEGDFCIKKPGAITFTPPQK